MRTSPSRRLGAMRAAAVPGIIAALALGGCAGGGSVIDPSSIPYFKTPTPEQVVANYGYAWTMHDCEAVLNLGSTDFWSDAWRGLPQPSCEELENSFKDIDAMTFDILSKEETPQGVIFEVRQKITVTDGHVGERVMHLEVGRTSWPDQEWILTGTD